MFRIQPVGRSLRISSLGFSLIELIAVILILGILSVLVLPKFLTASNFTEYTYRSDIIAKLRLVQTRAMQQTNDDPNYCHRLLILSTQLGVPRGNCNNAPLFNASWQAQATDVVVEPNDNVTFSTNATNNTFTFDSMGRPQGCNVSICKIIVTGEQSLTIIIEEEGYVHAS